MIHFTEQILANFETGSISRREAAKKIAALAVSALGITGKSTAKQAPPSTFQATGLNHIGLQVSNVERTREFYQKHLGLSVIRDNTPNNCFMACGDNYLGLFRSESIGMDHYCYTVEGYHPDQAEEKLKQAGIDSRREENRVYFDDPDGLTVQVAGKWDSWPGPPPKGR